MAFLRAKRNRGETYLYLVRSVWDPGRKAPRQEIIKYLGRASQVTEDDIPEEHRGPGIAERIAGARGRAGGDGAFRRRLYDSLQAGDLQGAVRTYRDYRRGSSAAEFYEGVLQPVMHRIGELWSQGRITVGAEHVCSNTAHAMIGAIRGAGPRHGREKILVCSPAGEEHSIGCAVLEAHLVSKGYSVLNMSPSAPAESVLEAIEDKRPAAVLISVSMEDSARTGSRLARRISERHGIPVIIGGRAAAGEAAYRGSLGGIAREISARMGRSQGNGKGY